MRNVKWLRFGLGSCVLAGASISLVLVACGDDNTTPVTVDGGALGDGSTLPTTDGGGTTPIGDGGTDTDADAAPAPQPAKIQFVNAATDLGSVDPLGAIRVCYALGTDEASAVQAPIPPLPQDTPPGAPLPGLYIGTGGAVPSTGTDLSQLVVVPYLMNAQRLGAIGGIDGGAGAATAGVPAPCSDLIGPKDAGGQLLAGVDYWRLPALTAGTLKTDHSYILVLTGCAGDSFTATPAIAAAKCGTGFVPSGTGNGNLTAHIIDADRATVIDSQKIGAAFFNASAQSAATITANPGFITGTDTATFKSLTNDGGSTEGPAVAVNAGIDMVQIGNVNVATDSFTANKAAAALSIPLAKVNALTFGAATGGANAYALGKGYTFIALGDPTVDPDAGGGNFNPRTYHYVALPNDPTITTFGQ